MKAPVYKAAKGSVKPVTTLLDIPTRTEFHEQCELIEWADCKSYDKNVPPLASLLFAVANGRGTHIVTRMKMTAEGVRSGVPDLILPVARHQNGNLFHALFIEMKKAEGGTVSKNQREWHSILLAQGFCVVICHGFEPAKQCVKDYLQGKLRMKDTE